ncbi:MAG: HNH endonuclease [Sulfobacillus acidophilus]|uniref:HNH endonuclease n=1 Tax=Sulfobacillus acidophilus TaxID=53633 RepID=A0A2T2WLC9_9FIRM|nr:MAG: HNH endonuclease [Sulfobacillus acidophilus]
MAVLVLDKRKNPLMPCSEKRARLLLERGRARVHRMVPFTIRLVDRRQEDSGLQDIRLKLDPGSQTTGAALVREVDSVEATTGEIRRTDVVLMLLELQHRGHAIRDALTGRRAFRKRRRGNLRYRAPRFNNRARPAGWLAPALQHRVDTTMAWVSRLRRWVPVTALSQERVRFDTQALQNPEISGAEYQPGTLAGYEIREYRLEQWGRACAYCEAENTPLEIDHIHPKSRGDSDHVSNLAIVCHDGNQAKGTRPLEQFLAKDPQRVRTILAQAQAPLCDAAAVNSTRWVLFAKLNETELPVEVGAGNRTKWNRHRLLIPKAHCLDAACVGRVDAVQRWQQPVLQIKATGRGRYQRTRLTRHGFPRGYLTQQKRHFGFQTGDMVKAVVTKGKKIGAYWGRVAIRASGRFDIQTGNGRVQGIHHRFCQFIQRADGYGDSWATIASTQGDAGVGAAGDAALSLPGIKAGVSRAIG